MKSLAVLAMTCSIAVKAIQNLPYGPTVRNFTTNLDHYSSGGNFTKFNIRYIINAEYWDPQTGPILFYAGNEGSIWKFYNNTDFVTHTLAKELKGLILFGEHRYFGESYPS